MFALIKALGISIYLAIYLLLCGRYIRAVPYYVRPDPPYFTKQPQTMSFFNGDTKTLSCAINVQNIISGYNTIEIDWEFDGNIVENPEMLGDVTLTHNGFGQSQLRFQNLNKSNAGRYRCVMRDGLFSIVSEVAELILYEFNGFIEPSVSNITTYNGDSVYIDCRANTTLPIQLVTWYKNDVRLQPELNRTHITMPDGVLVIYNTTYSDAGIYKCRLSLVSQFQQRSVEVIIETPAADTQLKFLHKPQNKSAFMNDSNVYMLCVATGGVSSYTWLKDGVNINETGIEYQLIAGGSILKFISVTTKMQGFYTCVVKSESNQTISSMAWFQILIAPVIDDSVSTNADILIDIEGNSVPFTLNCPIKNALPTPNILWLHNGIPINLEDSDISLVFHTEQHSTENGYKYILRITSNNGTYQFVYDNVIGMYQCIASNEAGYVIINQRVLFKFKPNAVDRPILHDPECDDGCSFLVSWNETDHFYSSLSHVNYVVYISVDGKDYNRASGCINVHGTYCTIEYDITEIRFGNYAVAVQTVFSYSYLDPDKTSDISNSSNVLQLDHDSYPRNAIKPCEVTCSSYTQDTDIYMYVSWKLCPYEQFIGFVNNYVAILDCSYDDPNVPYSVLRYTTLSPAVLNHTFKQVPCYRHCKVMVRKLSSAEADSNSTITVCERTPMLSPQSSLHNITVNRTDNTDARMDVGIDFIITFDFPPVYEMCSSDPFSHVFIKTNTSDVETIYDHDAVRYSNEGQRTVDLKINKSHRWEAVLISVTFNNSQGRAPWSEWNRVLSAHNGNIEVEDFKFHVIDYNSSSITVSWTLNHRADSMKQAAFIKYFQYNISNNVIHRSNHTLKETFTFSDLQANTSYDITSRVVTNDNKIVSFLEIYAMQKTAAASDEKHNDPTTASVTSNDSLSDEVIIVITVCIAVVLIAGLVFLIFRRKSWRICKTSQLAQSTNVVSHHLLQQTNEGGPDTSTSPSTQSDIGVPTTPKEKLVKDWLTKNNTLLDRNNPPGSDGQHAPHSEEIIQSDGSHDNEMDYMLSTINKNPFKLDLPPAKRNKNIARITAEVHRPSDENKVDTGHSSVPFSDKEGDYTKIASDAPGASTSGGSKHCLQMDNFNDNPKPELHFSITQFCSTSPKPFQDCSELVPMQQKDSSVQSSGSEPYVENNEDVPSNDSPPYFENENVQLLAEKREPTYDCIVQTGNIDHVSPPSILLSSHNSESSSVNFQGEGYVGVENAILHSNSSMTNNQSAYSQVNNANAACGFAMSFDDNISTSKEGQYISQAVMHSILTKNVSPQQTIKQDASIIVVKQTSEDNSSANTDNSATDV